MNNCAKCHDQKLIPERYWCQWCVKEMQAKLSAAERERVEARERIGELECGMILEYQKRKAAEAEVQSQRDTATSLAGIVERQSATIKTWKKLAHDLHWAFQDRRNHSLAGISPDFMARDRWTGIVAQYKYARDNDDAPTLPPEQRVDPPGCACTDCLTGESRPEQRVPGEVKSEE